MCVACDLLDGLDLDALDAAVTPARGLHLPDGGAGIAFADAAARGLARIAPSPAITPWSAHWAPGAPPPPGTVLAWGVTAWEGYRAAAVAGRVPAGLRLLLPLPSPFTWLSRGGARPEAVAGELEALTSRLAAELEELAGRVPVGDLALQWNLAAETALWESRGRDLTAGRQLAGPVLDGLARLAEGWPTEGELGFHLCRRDADGATPPDPLDAAQISHLAGALLGTIDRIVQFLHLPAPVAAAAAEWYAPLSRLVAWSRTEVHLGLARDDDTPERFAARSEAARAALRFANASAACCAAPQAARALLTAEAV